MIHTWGLVALAGSGLSGTSTAQEALCIECISVRIGPPTVLRGPFPDELDAPFSALKLPDGRFRGFTANGATYAVEGDSLWDMSGERHAVLGPGPAGDVNECGRWLASALRAQGVVLGFVHQESICDYGPGGSTDKTMAMAVSEDDGLTWTDLGTVISGPDQPARGTTSGEGDCTMIDGQDGFLYGYCLRNADWRTYVARAPMADPTNWRKYFEGTWREPGLDGRASEIGFVGTGAAYLEAHDWVAVATTDPWFEGVRLSLSADKVDFVDLPEPLLPIDGADWNRPADSELIAYLAMLNPDDGSTAVGDSMLLSYVYVPSGQGFEARYLVQREMTIAVEAEPPPVQAGVALTRWRDATGYRTSSGPQPGYGGEQDAVVAYLLTHAPDGIKTIKLAECSDGAGDQVLMADGTCEALGYRRDRTAGWLFAEQEAGSVPVYFCTAEDRRSHFASAAADCEGLGRQDTLLGYGLAR